MERTMKLLSEKVERQVREALSSLTRPVLLRVSVREDGCETCGDLATLAEEVAATHEKLSVEVIRVGEAASRADNGGGLGAPAIRLLAADGAKGWRDYGVVFYGTPSGYEFTSLISSLLLVSTGDSGLAPATRKALAGLASDVDINVFVTPTCPYCPRAVVLAHQMAVESPRVRAAMVEAMEFPEETMRHGVSGVPHSVINQRAHVVGAIPEAQLLAEILHEAEALSAAV
jgi:glutaredoxin-like protein